MFGFLKKKKNEQSVENNFRLVSAVAGKSIPLSEVPDPVFAQKMAGDGIAIDTTGDTIVAPADGELTLVFKTKHAFALTLENGVELLVQQLVEQGTKVKAGTPIIKIDRELIKSKGLSLITPILITNPDILGTITPVENIDTIAGETTVIEYTVK